jgi:O-antigen/teichoic acid export membrane protein
MITVIINALFIPRYGYVASAWAHLICYTTMVIVSYAWSRKHYAIPYKTGRILAYIGLALAIYVFNELFLQGINGYKNIVALLLLLLFSGTVIWAERKTFNAYKS